jgi:hypothetical protein
VTGTIGSVRAKLKIFFWMISVLVLAGAGFIVREYLALSGKWIAVEFDGEDSFARQLPGEFRTRQECEDRAGAGTKPAFCGRGCLVQGFMGEVTPDEYDCMEKVMVIPIGKIMIPAGKAAPTGKPASSKGKPAEASPDYSRE